MSISYGGALGVCIYIYEMHEKRNQSLSGILQFAVGVEKELTSTLGVHYVGGVTYW